MRYDVMIKDLSLKELNGISNVLAKEFDESENDSAFLPPPVSDCPPPLTVVSDEQSFEDLPKEVTGIKVESPTGDIKHIYREDEFVSAVSNMSDKTEEIDAEGLIWDERIHSSNKKKKTNNCWSRRRNITDELYNSVKAELLGGTPSNNMTPFDVPPPPVALPTVTPIPTVTPVALPPVNQMTPVALPPASQMVFTLQSTLKRIQEAFATKKVDGNYINTLIQNINQKFGIQVTGLPEISGNQEALNFVNETLTASNI